MTYDQSLPFRIRVRRWWQSPTQWTFVLGGIVNVGPLALSELGLLGLHGTALFLAIVGGNLLVHGAGAILHYQTTTVIGDRRDVEASKAGEDA